MKNCLHCSYADWTRTEAGKLHPSGEGQCKYQFKVPPLPASMYWLGNPYPCGGRISRRDELKEHCTYFSRAASKQAGSADGVVLAVVCLASLILVAL